MERRNTAKDVIVVGGGPAGLHSAYRLASAGADVTVIEVQPRIGDRAICSGVVGEEAFSRFDLPTQPVLTNICSIQAISPKGRILEHRLPARLARVVDKGKFNQALALRALSAGAEIHLGVRVDAIEREKHGVCLSLRSSCGEKKMLLARVAIIASGVECSLNRDLGLATPREYLSAIQADVPVDSKEGEDLPTRVYVGRSVAPGAFGWEIPLGNGCVRVGLMTRKNPKPYFKALLRRIVPSVVESRVKFHQKGIAQAPVGKCISDRILVVGEAAGHVKTSTGGGIYYGLMSAEFGADVVLRALRKGQFTCEEFTDFERYWRKAFGGELRVGYIARKMASYFPDSEIERFFDVAISNRNFHFELPLHPKTYACYPVVSTANSSGLFEVVVGHILAVLRSRCAGFACPACLAADTYPARPLLST